MSVTIDEMLNAPAEKLGNDPMVEMQWAMRAYHHAETYFNLITAVDPAILKLTPTDDEIYKDFREEFKDMKVDILKEDELKSVESKKKWREFCMNFEGKVEDYHMGTLLRLNCNDGISEENTSLVPRIQFLAIEISRNREGLNSGLKEKFKPKKDSKTDTTQEKS